MKKIIDPKRRQFLGATGLGAIVSVFGSAVSALAKTAAAEPQAPLRWGFVGTGMIATSMARAIKNADSSQLVAVSSRRMTSATAFADSHNIESAFDSWAKMIASDEVDAIYVATPTSVREEICIAAAQHGKHVLGEKPFASLPSLQRITAACRDNGVGFMDGTHFVHHPRTSDIKARMQDRVGWPWSLDSAFQANLKDKTNIRFNTELEPLGAIGDTGWYNMRAAVEYLSADVTISSTSAYLRRDSETGAAISGSGCILFSDGSTTTWNCGFDSGALNADLRISGADGVIRMDDFLMNGPDGSASYTFHKGGFGPGGTHETIDIASPKPGATLMFQDFALMVSNTEWRERSIRVSERTQLWLDAIWSAALKNEQAG